MRSIIFDAGEVNSVLHHGKTELRRVIKPQPKHAQITQAGIITSGEPIWEGNGLIMANRGSVTTWDRMPYRPGDILYVRETWAKLWYVDPDGYTHYDQPMYFYAADGTPDITLRDENGFELDDQRTCWRPSIQMPREAARIFFKVSNIRVERLQEIGGRNILNEGIDNGYANPTMGARWINAQKMVFSRVWNERNAAPRPVKENGAVVRYESYPWENVQEAKEYREKPWYVIGNPWVYAITFQQISPEEAENNE